MDFNEVKEVKRPNKGKQCKTKKSTYVNLSTWGDN